MTIDGLADWLTSHLMDGPDIVMTEYGPMNLTKARILAKEGELSLVPLKTGLTGMREIRFNTLLYDILTAHGFNLNLLTGDYEYEADVRDASGQGKERSVS